MSNTVSILQNPNGRNSSASTSLRSAHAGVTLAPRITVKQRSVAACRQELVIVDDRSGSMSGSKIKEASNANLAMLNALGEHPGLRAGIVDFGSDARIKHGLTTVRDLTGSFRGLSESDIDGGTNIGGALRLAGQVLDDALRAEPDVRRFPPVIALFSDGADTDSSSPDQVAAALKSKGVTIVTIAFGTDADETMLRAIDSSPAHFYRAADGKRLAEIFRKVGHTLSVSIAAGVNPTAALGQLGS